MLDFIIKILAENYTLQQLVDGEFNISDHATPNLDDHIDALWIIIDGLYGYTHVTKEEIKARIMELT